MPILTKLQRKKLNGGKRMANERNGNFMYLIQEDNFSRTSMHASNHGIFPSTLYVHI